MSTFVAWVVVAAVVGVLLQREWRRLELKRAAEAFPAELAQRVRDVADAMAQVGVSAAAAAEHFRAFAEAAGFTLDEWQLAVLERHGVMRRGRVDELRRELLDDPVWDGRSVDDV